MAQFINCPVCDVIVNIEALEMFPNICNWGSQCAICFEKIMSKEVMLNCGHFFCSKICWLKYVDDSQHKIINLREKTNCKNIYLKNVIKDFPPPPPNNSILNKNLENFSTSSYNCSWYDIDEHEPPVKSFGKYSLYGKYCGWCHKKARSWVRRRGTSKKWSACCALPTN